MIRALILVHRWLGVAFCLLFAMWFASGIVMHFVPFPALTETARFAGLAPIGGAGVKLGPAEALKASGLRDATHVRLIERNDGPVYLVAGATRTAALRAADLSDAAVHSQQMALAIAQDYAQRRGQSAAAASLAGFAAYDQWTLSERFDRYRPLYRVVLGDDSGTELYVSAATGEVVLETNHRERAWNYAGSIAHWIYPTALRSHPAAWSTLLWWLSLLALIGASAGTAVGTLRIGIGKSRPGSPYRGWHALHHWLGLCWALFVLSWIFSGWLSMDDGLLFSTGKVSGADMATIAGIPAWEALPPDDIQHLAAEDREVEWFAFGGRIYRRERAAAGRQHLYLASATNLGAQPDRAFLRADEIDAAAKHLERSCNPAFVVGPEDAYAIAAVMPGAPVFRVVCGVDWLHIDASNGAPLEKLDASRRAYRWLYAGLHTLDFPILMKRPALRTTLIVALCTGGFLFNLTAIVIAWRRLLSGAPKDGSY